MTSVYIVIVNDSVAQDVVVETSQHVIRVEQLDNGKTRIIVRMTESEAQNLRSQPGVETVEKRQSDGGNDPIPLLLALGVAWWAVKKT